MAAYDTIACCFRAEHRENAEKFWRENRLESKSIQDYLLDEDQIKR